MYEENIATEEVKDVNPQDSQVVDEKPKKKFNWKKFVGYFVLGLVVLGIGYLGYRFYAFKPYRVIVSNVTSRSATISWVTEGAEPGMVVYKEGNTVLPIWISKYGMGNGYDDRDYSNAELEAANRTQENIAESGDITAEDIETEIVVTELGTYWSHHVTIRNLDPETEYEFMVGDGLVFEKADTVDTETTKVSTLTDPESVDTPIPAYGLIKYYDGDSYITPLDTIIYCELFESLTESNSLLFSSVISETGGWYLDLSNASTSEGERFLDSINDEANITLRLTIESEWLGRWSKEMKIEDSSPAEGIILYDQVESSDDNIDEFLKYEGVSFEEEDVNISDLPGLINKAYAETAIERIQRKLAEDRANRKSTTQLTKAQAIEAARWTGKAVGDIEKIIDEGSAESATEEQIEKAKTAEKKLPTVKVKYNNLINKLDNDEYKTEEEQEEVFNLLDSVDRDLVLAVAENEDDDETGQCYGNICTPETAGKSLICGWVDSAICKCTCGTTTMNIKAGNKCSCSNGAPNETEMNRDPKSETGLNAWCLGWDDRDPKTTGCYSSTGNCYHLPGYTSNDKTLTCYGGQWIAVGQEGYWSVIDVKTESEPVGYCNWSGKTNTYVWTESKSGTTTEKTCLAKNNTTEVNCYTYAIPIENGVRYFQSTKESLDGFLRTGRGYYDQNCEDYKEVEGGIISGEVSIADAIENIESGNGCFEDPNNRSGELEIYTEETSYKCERGEFVEFKRDPRTEPEPLGNCYDLDVTTYFKVNDKYERYECIWGAWMKKDQGGVIGINYEDNLTTGENCTKTQCNCNYKINYKEYICPDGNSYSEDIPYCNKNEARLGSSGKSEKKSRIIFKTNTCEDEEIIINENSNIQIKSLVYADSSYMINTTEGIVNKLGVGTYVFEIDGDKYLVEITSDNIDKDIYLDINSNGIIDEGDKNVSENFETVNVKTIEKQFGYTLKEGFNFVSFPFIFTDEDIKTASDLLMSLNERYNNAFYSISKYDSGKWVIVGSNGGTYDQNDFQLIPGQGYVLKAKTDIYITLYGNEVTYESPTDSAPIRFMPGWNLVGLYGTSVKSYTAESILADITNYTEVDFTAVNVSRWVESRALYEALQRDEDSTVYGLDFPIELKKSYFIKVTEGSGNWEPGIR